MFKILIFRKEWEDILSLYHVIERFTRDRLEKLIVHIMKLQKRTAITKYFRGK